MNLKEKRNIRGLSIKELSSISGVPVRTIEDIEKRGSCNIDTAIKLSLSLNMTLDELCDVEKIKKQSRLYNYYLCNTGERILEIDGRFYDTKTKNEDFLLAADYFESHGMKDWYFPLEIKDPGLIDIIEKEGHIKATAEEKSRIIEECKNNFWFYLREVCPISLSPEDIAKIKALQEMK